MPRRLLLALVVLVAGPLVLLGWFTATAMREQQSRARSELSAILHNRLDEFNRNTRDLFSGYRRSLVRDLAESTGTLFERLRNLERTTPVVRQSLFISDDGSMLYPPRPRTDDAETLSIYSALDTMIGSRPIVRPARGASSDASKPDSKVQQAMQQPAVKGSPRSTATSAWQVWYMDEGAQVILWVDGGGGTQIGLLLERTRWMSDLTARLPDASYGTSDQSIPVGSTALVDEAQRIVYRWGDLSKRDLDEPQASVSLSEPLTSWKFQYFSAPLSLEPSVLPLVLSLGGIGIVFLALGGYVLTSVRRQMRAARSRVSFAGQVSHELRTPLTNIRLYAELANGDLESLPTNDVAEKLRNRLGVIDTETRRLSRLVCGVLELTRDDVQQRAPQLSSVDPHDLIVHTIEQFRPSFDLAGIQVELDSQRGVEVQLDADIIEMILVNLLSNVEKYAADGKYAAVRSRMEDGHLMIQVCDRGPGIAGRNQRNVFRPFTRLDNSINAPTGTGIGLTIARRAARRHGGDLQLVASSEGACFEIKIPVEN